MKRLVVGFLISPLVPILCMAILIYMVRMVQNHEIGDNFFEVVGFMSVYATLVSYPVAAIFGIPTLLLALKHRLVHWYHSIFAGVLLSLLPTLVIVLTTLNKLPDANYFVFSTFFAVWGAVVTLSFWLIGRPDKFLESRA